MNKLNINPLFKLPGILCSEFVKYLGLNFSPKSELDFQTYPSSSFFAFLYVVFVCSVCL